MNGSFVEFRGDSSDYGTFTNISQLHTCFIFTERREEMKSSQAKVNNNSLFWYYGPAD
jgi:hypothetical protein